MFLIIDLGNLLNERKPQPTLSDLEGAANAILRLQTTFDLDTHLLVKGIIGNHQAAPLSGYKYYDFGRGLPLVF